MKKKVIKTFAYVPSKEMTPTYLRDKFARIRAELKREQEAAQKEVTQKVRKIK